MRVPTFLIDIDECIAGMVDCHVNATCNSTFGSVPVILALREMESTAQVRLNCRVYDMLLT